MFILYLCFVLFYVPPAPPKNISSVSHGLVSPLPIKLIITRSIGAKLRAIAVLPAAPCSAAGGHEFAKLRAHSTRPRAQCVGADTLAWDRRNTRDENEKTTLFILRWPRRSQRRPTQIRFGLQVSQFVTSWCKVLFIYPTLFCLIYLFPSSRK